jgi:hypothetical protein
MLYQLYARRFPYWATYEQCRSARLEEVAALAQVGGYARGQRGAGHGAQRGPRAHRQGRRCALVPAGLSPRRP